MNLYHKRFLSSFASENIIGLFSRYKGAPKEITESWAMLEAVKTYIPNYNQCTVIIVGDGCSPRTGALLAYYTKATVISVDPNFNLDHWEDHVTKQTAMGFPPQRLTIHKSKIEDLPLDCNQTHCVVLWPHSHANMNNTNIINYTKRTDIAMPCCIPLPKKWTEIPHITFDDFNILSPKRTLHIWNHD